MLLSFKNKPFKLDSATMVNELETFGEFAYYRVFGSGVRASSYTSFFARKGSMLAALHEHLLIIMCLLSMTFLP